VGNRRPHTEDEDNEVSEKKRAIKAKQRKASEGRKTRKQKQASKRLFLRFFSRDVSIVYLELLTDVWRQIPSTIFKVTQP
jgi:hypothetical protein